MTRGDEMQQPAAARGKVVPVGDVQVNHRQRARGEFQVNILQQCSVPRRAQNIRQLVQAGVVTDDPGMSHRRRKMLAEMQQVPRAGEVDGFSHRGCWWICKRAAHAVPGLLRAARGREEKMFQRQGHGLQLRAERRGFCQAARRQGAVCVARAAAAGFRMRVAEEVKCLLHSALSYRRISYLGKENYAAEA